MSEGRRRWEEMNMDCLAYAFSKAGMESLLLAVPFVCKSWHKAALNPKCWTCLEFPDHRPYPVFVNTVEEIDTPPRSFGTFYDKFIHVYRIDKSRFSITAFVKMVVDKSKGKATELELPMCGTEAALRYVADACPLLRALTFVDDLVIFKHSQILPEVIGKWKFLEKFFLGGSLILTVEHVNDGRYFCKYFQELLAPETPSCYNVLERIIVQIGTHCKQFRFLNLILIHLLQVEALAIVNFLPHLRTILAGRCIMERDSVLTVVRGCKELDIFYAKECAGFAQDDEEIYKLARQTGKIVCVGCVRRDEVESKFGIDIPTLLRRFVFIRAGLMGHEG
ncbi:hypothetical protein ACLB2K_024120 [Fragaria x ananassa]